MKLQPSYRIILNLVFLFALVVPKVIVTIIGVAIFIIFSSLSFYNLLCYHGYQKLCLSSSFPLVFSTRLQVSSLYHWCQSLYHYGYYRCCWCYSLLLVLAWAPLPFHNYYCCCRNGICTTLASTLPQPFLAR